MTDVYYTGSEEEWVDISIGSGNSELTDATIHYNYVPTDNTSQTLFYGCASGGSQLTASDSASILQKVLNTSYIMPIEELTADYIKYIDVTGDGVITAADSAAVLQKVLNSSYIFSCEEVQ